MITRMIIVTVPPERAAEAQRLWKQNCAPIMIQQPGCFGEQFLRSRDTPGELVSVQLWEDQKWIDAYRSGPAHQEILRHTRSLMGVSKVEVRNYEMVS
jgi:heme-degrading monooxygenase HmoA